MKLLLIIVFIGRCELRVFARARRVYRMVAEAATLRKIQANVWEDLRGSPGPGMPGF